VELRRHDLRRVAGRFGVVERAVQKRRKQDQGSEQCCGAASDECGEAGPHESHL